MDNRVQPFMYSDPAVQSQYPPPGPTVPAPALYGQPQPQGFPGAYPGAFPGGYPGAPPQYPGTAGVPTVQRHEIRGGNIGPDDEFFPPGPADRTCPTCKVPILTETRSEMGSNSWKLCCLLSFWGMCWIAFCCDDWKETVHTCPKCGTELGRNYPKGAKRGAVVVMKQNQHGQMVIQRN